jgi:hypothetical protein
LRNRSCSWAQQFLNSDANSSPALRHLDDVDVRLAHRDLAASFLLLTLLLEFAPLQIQGQHHPGEGYACIQDPDRRDSLSDQGPTFQRRPVDFEEHHDGNDQTEDQGRDYEGDADGQPRSP